MFHTSVRAATEAAAADQSLVMIVFGADWCAPCKQLKAKTLASRQFAEQAGALHVVEVDVDSQADMARDFRVEVLPTLVVLSPDDKIVGRRTGFVETAELLLWLQEARDRLKAGEWEGTAPGPRLGEFVDKASADQLDTSDLMRLVEMLGAPAAADRAEAAKLLRAQREQAVLPLIDGITNSYLGVRISASEVLRQLAPESLLVDPWQAPADLVEAVTLLRKWWAETGKLPSQPPEPRIDPARAASIAGALETLRGTNPGLRTEAMSVLVAGGTEALPSVRAAIKLSDKAGDQRTLTLLEDVRWAILIPAVVDHRASGVRHVLARGTGPERQAAAARLGRAGREAIPALAELAEDSDPLVVESAVRALSGIGGKDAISAMAALLKAGDSNLRMTAAQALGHTKSAAAVQELLIVLDDPNEIVACTALSALEEIHAERGYSPSGKRQPPEVSAGLKKCLTDPRWRVRAAAAETTGKLGAEELSEDLKSLLEDADGFVVKNALGALRELGATPEPEKLVQVAKRHSGLSGEVVELLVRWGTEDAVQATADMYMTSGTDGRLAILDSLDLGSERGGEPTVWQSLLGRGAAETDPRLRRATAAVLSAQPAKVAAALVAPLLSDEDAETRSRAAGVVLSVVGGERTVRTRSQGNELLELLSVEELLSVDDSEAMVGSGRRKSGKTNEPPTTPAQIAAWHAVLQQNAGASLDLVTAAALYATGDTNADLLVLQRALEAADKDGLARFSQSAALAAILPRLPWPAGRPVVERFCALPAVFLRMLTYTQRSAPGVTDFLLEPARFRAAADPASSEDLAASLPRLLGPGQRGFSLLSGTPRVKAVLAALLEATNAAWRATAIYCLSLEPNDEDAPVFERGAKDSNAWVRAAAVLGLARSARDRSTLEQRLGPLLADPDKKVVERAALALLEPETRAAAGMEYGFELFLYEAIQVWPASYNPGGEQRPLAILQGNPPFLDQVRRQLQNGDQEDALLPALLLAQYGDFMGLDRVLALAAASNQPKTELENAIPAMVALSRDPKYLTYLKPMAASAKETREFRRLLQALKGMTGAEARELRLQINRRMRQGNE